MVVDENQNSSIRQESYCTEYKEVGSNYRFFVSVRFIIAAFAITVQSALFNLYNQALRQPPPWGFAMLIPFVGITTMIVVIIIERRTIALFNTMVQRGKELEFSLDLTDGQFSRLSQLSIRPKGWKGFATHTSGINLIYGMILAMWGVFLVLGFY